MNDIERAIQHMKNSIKSYENNLRAIATVNSTNKDWDGVSALGQPISIEDKKYVFSIKGIEACEIAITALQEMLAREQGCEFCDGKIYEESAVEWLELELVNNSLMVGVKLPMYEYSKSEFFIQFCPMCGRKLGGGEHD